MSHYHDDRMFFSSNLEDWYSTPEKREAIKAKYRESNNRKKSKGVNPGYAKLSGMNDQLRGR